MRRTMARALSLPALGLTLTLGPLAPLQAQQPPEPAASAPASAAAPATLPGFAELQAAGARIGRIQVRTQDIFDLDDPREDKWLFRWANRLHVQTRPSTIEKALLFKTGDPVNRAVIEETERVLRSNRILYDVQIRPLAVNDGVVDVEVLTRDTWTLDPGVSAGRTGGVNSSSVALREYNLMGSGAQLGISHSRTVDRNISDLTYTDDRAFGGRAAVSAAIARNSDGRREAFSLARPFYGLDTPWAAGASTLNEQRIDAQYQAGVLQTQYRHRLQRAEAWAGWSTGRRNGWVQRTSLGWRLAEDRYAIDPALPAPAQLPEDERLVGPLLRYELIEDHVDQLNNRNQIERPEYFAVGLRASVQLHAAATGFGASRDLLDYSAGLSRGFEGPGRQLLLAALSTSGRLSGGQAQRQALSGQLQYFRPLGTHRLFYAAASLDTLRRPGAGDVLMLGGDNGLRGYPLRYQAGVHRALITVEQRAFTDLYVWRLFRVGGAAFADLGRAWGGPLSSGPASHWLGDVGVGLRIQSARSAFGNVLHIDVATPVNAPQDVKRWQLLVKTKASF